MNNIINIKLNRNYEFQPKTREDLQELLIELFKQYHNDYDYNSIDTSLITSMTDLFDLYSLRNFNGDISKWNVSNVQYMSAMFYNTTSFNQPIGNWNVSNVQDMRYMFCGAKSFNQPLNNWNTSNVKDMSHMFYDATSFNQSLNNWNTSNVQDMHSMFFHATSLKKIPSWFK